MGLFSSLNRSQKEAMGLLQIGTLLEFFDLMLYIHMAVLLNELFFPQTDPRTATLLGSFTFCLTHVFVPIGALIFGWVGDNIGRKRTLIITTFMMGIACLVMANLPTYAQIGIAAAWIMGFCRVVQGTSSMGEIMGAQIYMTESVRRPLSYPAVAFMAVAAAIGSMIALGIATLASSFFINWRIAFWFGAGIAIFSIMARTRLRETPEFLKLKDQQMREAVAEFNREDGSYNEAKLTLPKRSVWRQRLNYKTLLSYFLISCGFPVCFYLSYIYFVPILKKNFGYTAGDIIRHNFFLSGIMLISCVFWAYLSFWIHPLRIIKIRGVCFLLLMIALPLLIPVINSPIHLFAIQALILILSLMGMPADAVFIYHFPIYGRFTYVSFLYSLSRVLTYLITSFGLIYLTDYLGHFGLWVVTLTITVAYLYSIFHFVSLERKLGFYPNLV